MNEREWRIRVIRRNVLQGTQDVRDLEAVEAHGYVTKPPHDGSCRLLGRCLECCPYLPTPRRVK